MQVNQSHTSTKLGLFLQYHNKDNYVDSCGVGHLTNILSLSPLINMNSRFLAVISQLELRLKTECPQNSNSALPVVLHADIHYNYNIHCREMEQYGMILNWSGDISDTLLCAVNCMNVIGSSGVNGMTCAIIFIITK